jgi:hypothetical protein
LFSSISDNPNKAKFRFLAMKEGQFIQDLIKEQDGEMRELDSKILELQKRLDSHLILLREQEATLKMASKLLASANRTVSSMKDILSIPSTIRQVQPNKSLHCLAPVSPVPTSPRLVFARLSIEEECKELQKLAQAVQERSQHDFIDAEQELDAGKSMLYFIKDALQTSLDKKSRMEERMCEMKDLVTPRRRMPDELWVQIFTIRVMEDEAEHATSSKDGCPPYTVLRLTWVCRLWRTIITGQPVLWQYIPIPCSDLCCYIQRERIEYYIQNVKSYPPTVYMSSWTLDWHPLEFRLSDVLKQITYFKRLEIYVALSEEVADELLNGLRPNAHELVLMNGRTKRKAYTVLSANTLRRVDTLSCVRLQPRCKESSDDEGDWECSAPIVKVIRITTAHFNTESMIDFLRLSQTVDLAIKLISPYRIDDLYLYISTTLPHLTTLSADLHVLAALFDCCVAIPNVYSVTVQLDWNTCLDESLELWTTFLSAHQRKEQLTTLGISGPDVEVEQKNRVEMCIGLINNSPNINHLILEQSIVTSTLEILPGHFPPGANRLTITKSDNVTETHLVQFIRSVQESRSGSLTLEIQQCRLVSEQAIERLSQLATLVTSTNGAEIRVVQVDDQ